MYKVSIFLLTDDWEVVVGFDVNTLTPKFISWKQPFPGTEHVAHFPMSPLTLHPLHGGQTSQGKSRWKSVHGWTPLFNLHEGLRGHAKGVVYAQSS